MKVICIDAIWFSDRPINPNVRFPREGEIHEVVDEEIFPEGLYYELAGYPSYIFEAAAFIPLSDEDELAGRRTSVVHNDDNYVRSHYLNGVLNRSDTEVIDLLTHGI
jgi:hypothetical protein